MLALQKKDTWKSGQFLQWNLWQICKAAESYLGCFKVPNFFLRYVFKRDFPGTFPKNDKIIWSMVS